MEEQRPRPAKQRSTSKSEKGFIYYVCAGKKFLNLDIDTTYPMHQSHPLDPTLKASKASGPPTIRLLVNDK